MSREIESKPPIAEYPALPRVEVRNGDEQQAFFSQNARRVPQLVCRIRHVLE
jgi:hypothetical protein